MKNDMNSKVELNRIILKKDAEIAGLKTYISEMEAKLNWLTELYSFRKNSGLGRPARKAFMTVPNNAVGNICTKWGIRSLARS